MTLSGGGPSINAFLLVFSCLIFLIVFVLIFPSIVGNILFDSFDHWYYIGKLLERSLRFVNLGSKTTHFLLNKKYLDIVIVEDFTF